MIIKLKNREVKTDPMGGLTDVPGILVGNAEDKSGRTGCTVILCPGGAVPGVNASGGNPGTQQTDSIRPGTAEYPVHGVLLTGGSFFGLAAAGGVMRWLVEQQIAEVPLVPAAVIYDLPFADGSPPPDAAMAYAACQAASAGPVAEGNVGAGAGATVGKIYGRPMKGGLGTAFLRIPDGPVVAALAVVNALGDIWDRGRIVVGALRTDETFVDQTRAMLDGVPSPLYFQSTTIALVATTERLSKAEANRVARLADDGMARAISPNHTQWDGDTVFCLALGSHTSDGLTRDAVVTIVGAAAAVVLEKAIIRGALAAQSVTCAPK